MDYISGGYILIARKIVESGIWFKPPLYLKVWFYLLEKAQHSNYKKLKRGQLFVSIPDIQVACSWYIGYRKVTPTKDQIFQVIDWLRKPCEQGYGRNAKATMITTVKATHGMLITIENYCVYQNPKLYESNTESNDVSSQEAIREQRLPDNINKNVKNERNKKNIYAANFELFWAAYPEAGYQNSKFQTAKNFATLLKKGNNPEDLIQAAKNYTADCNANEKTDFFYKASNFVGQKEYFRSYLPDVWKSKSMNDDPEYDEYGIRKAKK